jgi:RHH-type transcriptional regulator, proline utilization regulon repressor / proline dehydrogenase / delta 1-pyrroline-5-carboxylate dehydrogenase
LLCGALHHTPMQLALAPATVVMPTRHLPRSDDSERAAQTVLLAQARRLRLAQDVASQAQQWTITARTDSRRTASEAILDTFGLATPEGKAFMRLAEALLRTPDVTSAWALLCENICDAEWRPPRTANRSVRAIAVILRWMARFPCASARMPAFVASPFVAATRLGIARAADQFIVATTTRAAIARMRRDPALRLCSIDCLGESARTQSQADSYFQSYASTIDTLAHQPAASIHLRHGISIKLSALEPRFGPRHRGTYAALISKVTQLARKAASAGIGLTIDAEEQERLESTLDVMAALIDDSTTRGWEGLGLAVQAYGLRASQVIACIAARARQHHRRMTVRLVKGAYWDSEIKRAQERGLDAFPVFTDKCATDVSYLLCAKYLFEQRGVLFPQFATHNAMTVAAIRAIAPPDAPFEFQRLHGMGEQLYRAASRAEGFPPVRTYAPVGSHEDLLAYLIRRLLENGANASFVRHFLDPAIPLARLVEDPIDALSTRLRERESC